MNVFSPQHHACSGHTSLLETRERISLENFQHYAHLVSHYCTLFLPYIFLVFFKTLSIFDTRCNISFRYTTYSFKSMLHYAHQNMAAVTIRGCYNYIDYIPYVVSFIPVPYSFITGSLYLPLPCTHSAHPSTTLPSDNNLFFL